jgi:hypothetical protein
MMPLFFFHYCDDEGDEPDELGIELPNLETAHLEARRAAIDMWAEAQHEGRDLSRHRFVIRDAIGNIVLELPLAQGIPDK